MATTVNLVVIGGRPDSRDDNGGAFGTPVEKALGVSARWFLISNIGCREIREGGKTHPCSELARATLEEIKKQGKEPRLLLVNLAPSGGHPDPHFVGLLVWKKYFEFFFTSAPPKVSKHISFDEVVKEFFPSNPSGTALFYTSLPPKTGWETSEVEGRLIDTWKWLMGQLEHRERNALDPT